MTEQIHRYHRQLCLPEVGVSGQKRLIEARVLIVGCGGLGSPAAIYLAAAGVGTIGLIDGDSVDKSNLHRQILFNEGDIGRKKIDCAGEVLYQKNSQCNIVCHAGRLGIENAREIFSSYDLVLDGTDNFEARYLINDLCVELGLPLVSASLFRFEGMLGVFNYRGGPTLRDLFPEPPPADVQPSCAESGVLGTTAGILGAMQAHQAVLAILDLPELLSGRVLWIDTLSMKQRIVSLTRDGRKKECSRKVKGPAIHDLELSVEDLLHIFDSVTACTLIDCREPAERSPVDIGGLQIPWYKIEESLNDLPRDRLLVMYCSTGHRSRQLALYLRDEFGLQNVRSLTGGLEAWIKKECPTLSGTALGG